MSPHHWRMLLHWISRHCIHKYHHRCKRIQRIPKFSKWPPRFRCRVCRHSRSAPRFHQHILHMRIRRNPCHRPRRHSNSHQPIERPNYIIAQTHPWKINARKREGLSMVNRDEYTHFWGHETNTGNRNPFIDFCFLIWIEFRGDCRPNYSVNWPITEGHRILLCSTIWIRRKINKKKLIMCNNYYYHYWYCILYLKKKTK